MTFAKLFIISAVVAAGCEIFFLGMMAASGWMGVILMPGFTIAVWLYAYRQKLLDALMLALLSGSIHDAVSGEYALWTISYGVSFLVASLVYYRIRVYRPRLRFFSALAVGLVAVMSILTMQFVLKIGYENFDAATLYKPAVYSLAANLVLGIIGLYSWTKIGSPTRL